MIVFAINGYWQDAPETKDALNGFLICTYHEKPKGYSDDEIFFYGLSEETIKRMIETGEECDGFIITDYWLHTK